MIRYALGNKRTLGAIGRLFWCWPRFQQARTWIGFRASFRSLMGMSTAARYPPESGIPLPVTLVRA
jgi:hypothetical protein